MEGDVLYIAGNGEVGRADGAFEDSSFNHPQGMAFRGDCLYVADTENHLIRKLDVKAKTVKTIAGTGKQADFMAAGGMGTSSPLNSPWDLVFLNGRLYTAMAGAHPIWVMDLETAVFQPFAGSGREALIDGPLDESALAQPSGITVSGKRLYFADSEASAVRYVDTREKEVKTVVGQDFFGGDIDGQGEEVRLQHPLGVFNHKGFIYITDTYNHKIKLLNPLDKTCRTILGNGQAGHIDGKVPQFYEPGGLSIVNNKMFIADTNNHAIRVVDMKNREVSTLQIKGLKMEVSKQVPQAAIPPFAKLVDLPLKTLKANAGIQLTLNINLPNGYHLNPYAPLTYSVEVGKGIQLEPEAREARLVNPELPIKISFKSGAEVQSTDLKVSTHFYYCREDNQGACYMNAVVWRQPIKIDTASGNTAVILDYLGKITLMSFQVLRS